MLFFFTNIAKWRRLTLLPCGKEAACPNCPAPSTFSSRHPSSPLPIHTILCVTFSGRALCVREIIPQMEKLMGLDVCSINQESNIMKF